MCDTITTHLSAEAVDLVSSIFVTILGSKRSWENILHQMEQRNKDIMESLLDMKAAMADTCSKISSL